MSEAVFLVQEKESNQLFVTLGNSDVEVLESLCFLHGFYMSTLRILCKYSIPVPKIALKKINNGLIEYHVGEGVFGVCESDLAEIVMLVDEIISEVKEAHNVKTCNLCHFN